MLSGCPLCSLHCCVSVSEMGGVETGIRQVPYINPLGGAAEISDLLLLLNIMVLPCVVNNI